MCFGMKTKGLRGLRKRRSTPKLDLFPIACAALGLFLLCSCAALDAGLESVKGAFGEKSTRESQVFRSEDYVVCRLNGGENAAALAEQFLGDSKKA